MLLLFSVMRVQAQEQITGHVKDSRGLPLPDVSIVQDGEGIGTKTDESGKFLLKLPKLGVKLIFRSIGYKNYELVVTNSNNLEVVMEDDIAGLDEVMVTAYGTSKKSSFTGSATVIDAKQLENVNTSNVAQGLQGLSAGVQVTNTSGRPGANPTINIRGIGSLTAEMAPLYVVDGVPSDVNLNAYSPSDIESITVMKDAAATSLYGSRAANGVIMITTKRGASGKARVNARAAWTTSDFAVKFPERVSPAKQWELAWEGLYNDARDFDGKSDEEAREYASNRVPSVFWNTTPLYDANGNLIRNYRSGWNMDYPVGLDGKIKPEAQRL